MCIDLKLDLNDIITSSTRLTEQATYCDIFNENVSDEIDSSLHVFQWNIRGFSSHESDLLSILHKLEQKLEAPTIIGLCETFLTKNSVQGVCINHYNHHGLVRENKKGGGVSILVKEEANVQIEETLNEVTPEYECLAIRLLDPKICFVELYRIPNTSVNPFLKKIESLIEHCKQHKLKLIIGSDLNLNLINSMNHKPTSEFLDLLLCNNLIPSITLPTRVTHNSATLIDNVITEGNIAIDISKYVIQCEFTDHYPCYIIIDTGGKVLPSVTNKQIKYRKVTDETYAAIKANLVNMDWSQFFVHTDVDYLSDFLSNTICNLRDKYMPSTI